MYARTPLQILRGRTGSLGERLKSRNVGYFGDEICTFLKQSESLTVLDLSLALLDHGFHFLFVGGPYPAGPYSPTLFPHPIWAPAISNPPGTP